MPIRQLDLERLEHPLPLYDSQASRDIESRWQLRLPAHTLMRRAGESVYRLSAALAPHAKNVWIACGGGNNGGDGLIAAVHWMSRLQASNGRLTVTWLGHQDRLPPDADQALRSARSAGITVGTHPPETFDLAIDAVLGLGLNQAVDGPANDWIHRLQMAKCPVLCVDLPSGLDGDHGNWWSTAPCRPSQERHTLQLLTLKPGGFTHMGRSASGQLWFDDLETAHENDSALAAAWLIGQRPALLNPLPDRASQHHVHKGSHGDVVVVGGATDPDGNSMAGAALLAARASLHAGAGRVYVSLLSPPAASPIQMDWLQPELMFRHLDDAMAAHWFADAVVVCGCGGGEQVGQVLPRLLALSSALVLDADALNAIASDSRLQASLRQRATGRQRTVLTPHPLEAARLLDTATTHIQANRLASAKQLAERYQCVVALKGSGTVVAAPGKKPLVNPTGNGLLATAGTGDVLAGMVGALLSQTALEPHRATALAVYRHGLTANQRAHDRASMTASDIIWQL